MTTTDNSVQTDLQPFRHTVYNSLPLIGEADQLLNGQTDLEDFFRAAGELICKFDLESHVGIGLLHKHNTVGRNQLMVENPEEIRPGKPALVMALTEEETGEDYVPVLWKLQGTDQQASFVALEHSRCAEAHAGHRLLVNRPEFLAEFRKLLLDFGYESILGLTIMRVQSLRRKAGETYIERSHPARVANVMTASTQTKEQATRLIRTSWSFRKGATVNGALMTKCEAMTQCEEPAEPGLPHIEEKSPPPHLEEPEKAKN